MSNCLVREEVHDGEIVHVCACGLGYADILIAYACEEYFETHGVNSEEIIKKAIYNPRTQESAKRTVVPP
ncbi:MAG: hypothetical protein ABSD49_15520 [Candidatus Bathyarchaeia archaeon]